MMNKGGKVIRPRLWVLAASEWKGPDGSDPHFTDEDTKAQ